MNLGSFKNLVKSASPLEIALFVLFVIYIVLPIETPDTIKPFIHSPLGLVGIFIITLYLFLYTNPILGILYIFVAFELIRRSTQAGNVGTTSYIQYSPSQQRRDSDLKQMNPVMAASLEEDVVSKMAPLGHSDPAAFVDSGFKPSQDSIRYADFHSA